MSCELLGHFAVGVQLCLGGIAFSSLIYKRTREFPRRSFRVWFLDVSKQAFGAFFVHCLNLVFSILILSERSKTLDPCVLYFLNVLLDTTVGVYILSLILKLVSKKIKSGDYGNPIKLKIWFMQTVLFSLCLLLMKIVVAILINYFPFIHDLGRIALYPFTNTNCKIIFVMLLFPLTMSCFQLWIIDGLIKKKHEEEQIESETSLIANDSVVPLE